MGEKSGNRNVYSAKSRVACSDYVTHILENIQDGLEVQNKMHCPQLPILTYKHLGSEDCVEFVNVDKA